MHVQSPRRSARSRVLAGGRRLAVFVVAAMLLAPGGGGSIAAAQSGGDEAAAPLKVAIKTAPPFVIENDAGQLEGISVELWDRVAARLGRTTEFQRMDLEAMLDATAAGEVDAAIAAISITPEREVRLDLSHGYHLAGLGIAVQSDAGGTGRLLAALGNLISREFMAAVGALAVLLMGVGVLVWLAERRGNQEQFPRDPVKGIGNGFWFSAVTMTTVGYGDRAPATLPGRLISLVWMFASIIVISAFTGTIASSLTAAQFSGGVESPDDLPSVRVGVVEATNAVDAMQSRGVSAGRYASVAEGLDALAAGEIDAFVHDHPILVHEVSTKHPKALRVLKSQFNLTSYAVAMPSESPLLEEVNRAILAVTRDPSWPTTLQRYLGEQD